METLGKVAALPAAVGTQPHKRPRPRVIRSLQTQVRRVLFDTPLNAVVTVLTATAIAIVGFYVVRWAFLDSAWVASSPAGCAKAQGACWAVIVKNWQGILFGNYPAEQRWRPEVMLGVFGAALVFTIAVNVRNFRLTLGVWLVSLVVFVLLMRGGVFGLQTIESDRWGGIPITIFVFLCSVTLGFPLAIVLAVARTGRLVSARTISVFLIEVLRPVPLIAVLFCTDLLLPMALPNALDPGKLGRVIICMGVFYACYQAEVIRAGLQAIPHGQIEASRALGLGPLQIIRLVTLPQALRLTVPATVNLLVVALKDTSLIVTVGLFDFAATATAAFSGNEWRPFSNEVYIVVALVYLLMTLTLTWLGHSLERRLAKNA
ncbi:MAG: amino acid ABC transporter permease [Proteobacteria bacterium]|nr:amino acid ABC transporter permease [Pseudomonadota bacterium]